MTKTMTHYHDHEELIGKIPHLVRARVRGQVLELLEPVKLQEGNVVTVVIPEVFPRRAIARHTVGVWNDARLLGPFPLTRRQIYEDL